MIDVPIQALDIRWVSLNCSPELCPLPNDVPLLPRALTVGKSDELVEILTETVNCFLSCLVNFVLSLHYAINNYKRRNYLKEISYRMFV